MFFNTNPYLMLAKLGGSLPKYQGNEGSSETNTNDSDGNGIPDNAVIEHGSAYWEDENGVLQMATVDPQGNWEIASNDEGQGSGTTDPGTGLTFSQAYRQARDAGEKTFTWNGKQYTTRSESESEEEFESKFNTEENTEENNDENANVNNNTNNENDEDLTDLEKAQRLANQAENDLSFRNPDEATILSGIGDNPFLELVDAVERGVKSFKGENYYDPGSKEDYMKYTIRNVSDQDLYYNEEDRLKMAYNPGKYLKDEEEIREEDMVNFLNERRKGRRDMYGKVKDFDYDLYELTGKGKTYSRFSGAKQGDLLEEKYRDADYLGYTERSDGSSNPYNYLERLEGSGDPNYIGPQGNTIIQGQDDSFLSRDFEGSSTPFNRDDDSIEWQRSMANPMNQPITMPTIPVTEIPLNNSEPELQKAIPYIPAEPVDAPVDPNAPGVEDLQDIPPNLARYGGGLPKYQSLGEFSTPTQGMFTPTFSGYSLSGNQISPFTNPGPTLNNPAGFLNTPVLGAPTTEDQYKPMTDAQMYANSQAVQRSMDSFEAFTADMNKRLENPSLSMNQVDTNPLNLPEVDFSPSPELQNTMDAMDYTIAESQGRLMGTGANATIIPSAEQMQQQSEEFSANLEEQMSNIPEYQGTQENLDRYDRSMELGFDGDLAAMDAYDESEAAEAQMRSDRADAIELASEKPSFGTRAYNTMLRVADSKPVQTYTKISDMAINMSKPITKIARAANERKQKLDMMNNAFLADNIFAATDADTSGNKGNYDPNTGIFRPDDKVISGTTQSAKRGGSFYKSGGSIDIDINTYKQLVAAGADITIL